MQTAHIAEHVIVYTYKKQRYATVTKPCTLASAHNAFNKDLNSLNSFKLVDIYEATPEKLALLEKAGYDIS